MSRLSDRLAYLKTSAYKSSNKSLKTPPSSSADSNLLQNREMHPPGGGWQRLSDCVWERCTALPAVLPDIFDSGFIFPSSVSAENLVMYDLETTGLSGGTGNVAFLVGMGRQLGTEYLITQIFLADYPGERAMLERFQAFYKYNMVSYNGISFDSQVLKTRYLLNRIPPPASVQTDLLYPARRLWRGKLEDLRMKTLETEVLDIFRVNDLPGSEAPEAWFRWLAGNEDRIDGVFRHNADDILTLARFLSHLEQWGKINPIEDDYENLGCVPKFLGMARQWQMMQQDAKASQWLRAGWQRTGCIECAHAMALKMKREGNYEQALNLWEQIKNLNDSELRASVELAKYWEHRQRSPQEALDALMGIDLSKISPREREKLEHRRSRLQRKKHK